MMLSAILAAAAAVQPDPPPPVVVQARATVRIVQGVRVSGDRPPGEALVRETKVRGADGADTPIRLIELL